MKANYTFLLCLASLSYVFGAEQNAVGNIGLATLYTTTAKRELSQTAGTPNTRPIILDITNEGQFWLITDTPTGVRGEIRFQNLDQGQSSKILNTKSGTSPFYPSASRKPSGDLLLSYRTTYPSSSSNQTQTATDLLNSSGDLLASTIVNKETSILKNYFRSSTLYLQSGEYIVFIDRNTHIIPRYITAKKYKADHTPLSSSPIIVTNTTFDITENPISFQLANQKIVLLFNALSNGEQRAYAIILNTDLSWHKGAFRLTQLGSNPNIIETACHGTPIHANTFGILVNHNAAGSYNNYYKILNTEGNTRLELNRLNPSTNLGNNYFPSMITLQSGNILFMNWWNSITGLNIRAIHTSTGEAAANPYVVENDINAPINAYLASYEDEINFGIFWLSPQNSYKPYGQSLAFKDATLSPTTSPVPSPTTLFQKWQSDLEFTKGELTGLISGLSVGTFLLCALACCCILRKCIKGVVNCC